MNKKQIVTIGLALGILLWPQNASLAQAQELKIGELPALELALPFDAESHWDSAAEDTPGIYWQALVLGSTGQAGENEIKFAVADGKFIPTSSDDTWFVYGWFGALQAIKQPYNVKYPEWGDRHNGIDFAGKEGIDVISASGGKVTFAGKKVGNTVEISTGNGYKIIYAHLQDISVKRGQRVKTGDLIGHLGATGTTNPHLHFEVDYLKKDIRIAINPVPLIDTDWSRVVVPQAEANQFYTDNQDPLTQPDFNW